MAAEQVAAEHSFVVASSDSEWYKNLKRSGSCLRLYDLLLEKDGLIHELGPEGTTVLHKAVQHGCVKLVKYILVDMFDANGNCTCRLHDADKCGMTRQRLVGKRCEYGSTAVNMVLVSGSPKMVLLLKWAIDMSNDNDMNLNMSVNDGGEPDEGYESCNVYTEIYSSYVRETAGSKGEEAAVNTGNNLLLEHVKDDAIDSIYESTSTNNIMIPGVYILIERALNEEWGTDQEMVNMLKNSCKKHVDFEFVPIAHVFLHFLVTLTWSKAKHFDPVANNDYKRFLELRGNILSKVLYLCKEDDSTIPRTGASMVSALFNTLDPRGRTILHAACENEESRMRPETHISAILSSGRLGLSAQELRECWNARDGAGRTFLHHLCIYDTVTSAHEVHASLDWDATLSPLCPNEFKALQNWSFPNLKIRDCKPIQLAVLFHSENSLYYFFAFHRGNHLVDHIQDAATLGNSKFIDLILKTTEFAFSYNMPAIHCAAKSGQVEVIQTILKHPTYEPMVQFREHGTALHLLLKRPSMKKDLDEYDALALLHVLPTSKRYNIINNLKNLHHDDKAPTMFSANEMTCINLLLQAGIDIWTPNEWNEELPTPGPMFNNEARIWWYDKVFKEVAVAKESISNAANATSVVAALVATASFIGPLQPPLSSVGIGGHIDTSVCAVRIYVVCNSLSFYFSIASILLAVLPAIPMPKESTFDELFRSQRCLKGATLMLLVAIVCILIGFSSASMAVMSTARHDRLLLGSCIVIGGMVCLVVLVIYIIRMLRLWFHNSIRFRRWFAEHMYF